MRQAEATLPEHHDHLSTLTRPPTSEWRRLGRALIGSRTGLLGVAIMLLIVFSAILAPRIAPMSPAVQEITHSFAAPTWQIGVPYMLGADHLGRDLFSRIVFGTRISLLIGLSAVGIAGTLGTMLGLVAGYQGGVLDSIIMRVADLQLSIPFLILAIAVIGVLGPGLLNLIVVLGITGWVSYSRVVRSEVLSVREREYVLAAQVLGAKRLRIMLRHVLPNVLPSVIVIASLEVARMILSEAALSFLGLGVQPPTPSWGSMVADGRNYIATAWWISAFPGAAIFLAVLGINLFGDWLRDTLDPRLRTR